MADQWFDIKKIKAAMKIAAGTPVSFAFGIAPQLENGQLAMHIKKNPEFLALALKKDGFKPSKILVGTARTEGGLLVVTCDSAVPKAIMAIKYYLKENKLLQKKVKLIGPEGEITDDDDDKIEDDQDAKPAIADDGQEAIAARNNELTNALKKLAPLVSTELKSADDARKAAIAAPFRQAQKSLVDGDNDKAESAIFALAKVLKDKSAASSPEDQAKDARKKELEAKLKALILTVKKELPDADAVRKVAMLTPIEQAKKALAKADLDAVESAVNDLDKVIKGSTAATPTPPADPTQPTAAVAEADYKAYKTIQKSVQGKLKPHMKDKSIAPQIGVFLKAFQSANQAFKDEDWGAARAMIADLDGELDVLGQLVAAERDAETDCRAQLKHLIGRFGDYQKLDKEKQDAKMLSAAGKTIKTIQEKMKNTSYAAALKDIEELNRVLAKANMAATWDDSELDGKVSKGRKGRMMKEAAARQEMIAVKELEVRVQAETLGSALDNSDIQALMNEHRNLISGEVKVFKGYRWMDDVQAALDGARKKRDDKAVKTITNNVEGMIKAIDAAKDRQLRMYSLLRGINKTDENADALKEAQEFGRGMTNHIPDVWLTEGPVLAKRLPMMIKSKEERAEELKKVSDIPDKKRKEENELFTEVIEHGSLKGADRTQFFFDEPLRAIKRDTMDERALAKAKEATALLAEYKAMDDQDAEVASEMKAMIESASGMAKVAQTKLKKISGAAAPDPSIGKDLMKSTQMSEEAIHRLREELKLAGVESTTKDSGSQYERLMKTYDEMIQRAYKIRDAGGTVSDVEKSMAHIPAEFWPAQFIENLQAWRKVERELAEERVQALFEKDGFTLGDAAGCLSFAKDIYGNLGLSSGLHGAATGANDTAGWMAVPAVASLIEGYIGQVQSGFGVGEDAAKAMETLDYSGMKAERLSDLWDNAANTTKGFISAVTNVKNVPGIPPKSDFVTEVIPVLSAIAAGIDLSIALNALRKSITMRVKTGRMIDEAELEYFSGEMRDGGAMVKAIKNERDARNRQVAKKGTDVASKSVILGGEATKAAVGAGWGTEQAVGHGLVVAGKAIEYGGKIVFAGIDWGVAEQAKKLIKEAQAGNPIARMEIMENSGLYAKMYIAILAKDGNKLAIKFIDQRGYDERSVMKPAVSLQILREAMLAHADQRDETQVHDSLALELSESVTGQGVTKAVKAVGKGAAALAKKVKDLPKDKSIEYDAAWKPSKAASLSTSDWQANKKDCIKKAGLYDESTGIDKAMKPCEGQIKAATDAIDSYVSAKNISSKDREKIIALVKKSQATNSKAMQVIADYYPGTNQGDLHQSMADYLVDLRRILGTHSNKLDSRLTELKLIKSDWTPPNKPGTTAAAWKANWDDAVAQCDLPKKDGGVGKALQAFEDAHGKMTGLSLEQIKEKRDARIEIRDTLKVAGQAVKGLWPTCTSFSGMTDYLDKMIDYLVKVSQNNDVALNGFDWEQSPFKVASKDALFLSATWTATYKAADKVGFINRKKGDCGMEKALKTWEDHVLSKPPAEIKEKVASKDLVKKRKEAKKIVAEISRSAEQLAAANPDAHSDFQKYIADLRRKAHADVAQLAKDQDETDFAITKVLSTYAWKQVYDAGVDAGAIAKNDKSFKELNKAIEGFEKVLQDIEKAKKPKDAYASAMKAQSKAADIQKALTNVNGTDGWSSNRLIEFLDFVRDTAQAEVEAGVIAQVIGGEKASFDNPGKFEFKNKSGWQKVKKKAVEAGIIADTKTNFGKSIDSYLSAVKKRDAAEKKKAKKPDAYKGAYDVALTRLKSIEMNSKSLAKQTGNANFLSYLTDAGKVCRTETRAQEAKAA